MRIAIIGSGISGNVAARILSSQHDVEIFESASHAGGHAFSVEVEAYGHAVTADVAFMVLNRRTYPNFCRLLEMLGVPTQESDMSLSVRCLASGLEFQGSSLNGLYAQRSNVFRPAFHRMLADILKFNRVASAYGTDGEHSMLLGEFLERHGFGDWFLKYYLRPMSAAIWSADPQCIAAFPAKFILGFFRNHGLLQLRDRPQWLTIAGRSQAYVEKLIGPIRDQVHLNCGVEAVRRTPHGALVLTEDGSETEFDHVVFATHADRTLDLLVDASHAERKLLSCFPYQANDAVLHTDQSVLPKRSRAWASWNYHVPDTESGRASVTYDLNRLQSLGLPGPLCLTLNPSSEIDPSKVIRTFQFEHPVFSTDSIAAQEQFADVSGKLSASFCGAYWGYGFHEDGVNSALAVTRQFGLGLESVASPPKPFCHRHPSNDAVEAR